MTISSQTKHVPLHRKQHGNLVSLLFLQMDIFVGRSLFWNKTAGNFMSSSNKFFANFAQLQWSEWFIYLILAQNSAQHWSNSHRHLCAFALYIWKTAVVRLKLLGKNELMTATHYHEKATEPFRRLIEGRHNLSIFAMMENVIEQHKGI